MQSFRADLDALYLPKRPSQGDLLELPEEEGRHVRTLRLRQGEPVLLLDGAGGRTQATIERIDRRAVVVRAGITVLDEGEGRPYIVLGIGLLADKSRFEWVVEKAVELGVREIHPLVTERSEGRLHAERIGRIAVAALKQSQRSFLPHIAGPTPFQEMVGRLREFNRACICHETAPIHDSMGRFLLSSPDSGRTVLLIGPEGGFSPDEVEAARAASAVVVSLGQARLRAETAALAALTLTVMLSDEQCSPASPAGMA